MRLILALLSFCAVLTAGAQTPPTAQFTANPLSACQGSPIGFTSTSTQGASPIVQYQWDFGDGTSASGTTTSHAYALSGTYTVTLVVTAANGQADAEVKTNYVTVNPRPDAGFTASANGCTLPVGVTFSNTSTGGASYQWNFGNSQNSTAQNPPVVNYTTAGTYNVSLIVTNSFGCKDTATQALVVSNYQAAINAPATACVGAPVSVTDGSTVGANSWNWSFPGASPASSTSQNNTVVYGAAGTYNIALTSQNTSVGCSGSATKQITILPNPVPSFTATPTSGCAPVTVAFTNTSPAGTSFTWNFGDGQTFTGQTPPPHTYAANGSYSVTLTMTNASGCTGSVTQTNLINLTAPDASFTSDVVNGCSPLDVQFTSTAVSTDPIVSYNWNFGNGNVFNGQNPPVQTYTTGVYDVVLTITTQGGCVSSDTVEEYIQVGEIDLVNFSLADSPECAKTDINFTNLSVISAPHDPDEVTYSWDFGDGGTSTQENPGYQYANDTGYFDVTLIVNFRGCRDTLIQQNAVYIKPPISKFQPNQTLFCNVGPNQTVTVNDQSIINSINPAQDALVTWKWGDGSPNTIMDDPVIDDADKSTTTHNYSGYGSYTIWQIVQNFTTGCIDSTSSTVHISMTDITSITALNDSVCENNPMTFNAATSVLSASHNPVNYSWDMGNGQTVTGQSPTYTYTSSGTYTIGVTATNAVGCADNMSYTPFRVLEPPTAAISADDNTGCAPFLVTFTNGSQVQGNGVPLASFTFTFPGGSTQTTTNVSTQVTQTFTTEGSFPVSLVATDQFGCVSAPASTTITLTKPTAAYTHDLVVCDEESFTVTNSSTGVAPLTYQWFRDGVQQTPTQNYSTSFDETPSATVSSWPHALSLIVTDANGCKDTLSSVVTVSTPIANLDYSLDGAATNANGDFLCPPVFADFTDLTNSLGDVTNYVWQFGDGKQSTLENPENTYVFPGTYSVTVTVTDEYGCTDDTTYLNFLTIFGPVATPAWSIDPGACGQDVTFDIGATSNVVDIQWDLDDNTIVDDSTNFEHTYLNVTTYNPTVTVYDNNDCQVIYPLDPITIQDNGLNAFFTYSPTEINIGQTVTFTDQSGFAAPITGWTWDLGTISPFTNNNGNPVSNYYVVPGLISVVLTIEDALGCFDQYAVQIFVDGAFEMPNVITANGDGVNDFFEFPIDIFASYDIVILNRWGNPIVEKTNQTGTKFWDGKNDAGNYVEDGVYFYKLRATLLDGSEAEKDGFLHVYAN
jgi:gliding motility-associated-like protein